MSPIDLWATLDLIGSAVSIVLVVGYLLLVAFLNWREKRRRSRGGADD